MITFQEKVEFAKNLAVMLKSGISINEALGYLGDQARSAKFKKIILHIQADVEKGTSLTDSFSKERGVFGAVFLSLLEAGEASGTLEENLTFLADWMERNNDLAKQIGAATLYPKIVLAATFLLGGMLAVFILPKLVPLFGQLEIELPLTTRILLAFSIFVQKFWLLTLLFTGAAIFLFLLLSRIRILKRMFHALSYKTPFIGSLLLDYQLALIFQLFYTLFKSGLDLRESLSITSQAATNLLHQDSLKKIQSKVIAGTTLSSAILTFPRLYPKSVAHIVATGEKSGTLDESFRHLADFYSKEVNNKTKRLPTIIEPVLLIVIGVIIGFVALAIITPIYELTRGFGE